MISVIRRRSRRDSSEDQVEDEEVEEADTLSTAVVSAR
jgi:hypothetical protein